MEKIYLSFMHTAYKNNGQEAERRFRFTLTGKDEKADNVPHDKAADCCGIQVKSARATVCKGTDLKAYLDKDASTKFAYVVKDFSVAYIMSRALYETFVKAFGTLTRESEKNGGGVKIRLKHESANMLKWLAERV